MEWTGKQQIVFLLQSVALGVVQGILFDVLTGFGRRASPLRRILLDVLFGILAALITFFGALVIMDGQLHPILFTGCALGLVIEHVTLGILLAKAVFYLRHFTRLLFANVGAFLGVALKQMGLMTKKWRKSRKNREKRP